MAANTPEGGPGWSHRCARARHQAVCLPNRKQKVAKVKPETELSDLHCPKFFASSAPGGQYFKGTVRGQGRGNPPSGKWNRKYLLKIQPIVIRPLCCCFSVGGGVGFVSCGQRLSFSGFVAGRSLPCVASRVQDVSRSAG